MFDDLNKPDAADKPFAAGGQDSGSALLKPESATQAVSSAGSEADRIASAKKELDDIFSDTEKPMRPEAFAPKIDQAPASYQTPPEKNTFQRVVFPVLMLAGVVALIAGGIWGYYRFVGSLDLPFFSSITKENEIEEPESAGTGESSSDEKAPVEEPAAEPAVGGAGLEPAQEKPVEPQIPEEAIDPTDSDRDGLTDQEEIQYGTNINSIDSDGDGLFDREEVVVYQTDPLRGDTDGDSYSDGSEVKSNYNPSGPGKLYEIK